MPKQIGWSNESNLLYTISSQISRLAGVIAASGGGGGGGTITGGGAAGQVTFWNGATSITGSNNLFWDNAQTRLGIGTNTPSNLVDVRFNSNLTNGIFVTNSSTGNGARAIIRLNNDSSNIGQLSIWGSGTTLANKTFFEASKDFVIGTDCNTASGGTSKFQVYVAGYNNATSPQLTLHATGNLSLGSTTDDNANKLQVSGSTLLNGNVTFSSSTGMFWDATNTRLGVGSSTFYNSATGWWGGAGQEQKIFLKSTTSAKFTSLVLSGGLSGAGGSAIQFLNYNGTPVADFGTADGIEIGFAARQNTADINFYTTPSGTTPTKRMAVMASGNVLIQNGGTFTDDNTNRLQVLGNAKITGETTITSAGSANGVLKINSAARPNGLQFNWFDAGNVGEIWYYSETRFRRNATELNLTLTSAGNVVLNGNTDTGERLRVNGDVGITGVLRETVTTNRQTASYTLVLTDRGKLVETNVGAANTITVPPNSSITFPIGTKIDIAQYGAGQTTIVPGIGVTVRSAGGALKLSAQYSGATIVKIGTDEWYLFGDITV